MKTYKREAEQLQSLDIQRKQLALCFNAIRRSGTDPIQVSFLNNQAQQVRRFRRVVKGSPHNPLPVEPLKERAIRKIRDLGRMLKASDLLRGYRIKTDVTYASVPSARYTVLSYYDVNVRLAVPFSAAFIFKDTVPSYGNYLPFARRSVEPVPEIEGGVLTCYSAFNFGKNWKEKSKATEIMVPICDLYVITAPGQVSYGLTRHGVRSGAITKATNKLAKALGE